MWAPVPDLAVFIGWGLRIQFCGLANKKDGYTLGRVVRIKGGFLGSIKSYLCEALLLICIFPSFLAAQTAEEIIAKNVAARGGAEKFLAIRSMLVTTFEESNWGGTGSSILRIARPDRMRFDYTWKATRNASVISIVTAFDGKVGWWADQHKGVQEPNTVSNDQLKLLQEQAEHQFAKSYGELQASGNTIELIGREAVEGKPCYKIRFKSTGGQIRFVYYDAESYLVVRTDDIVSMKDKKERHLTTSIGDYRSIDGILFPHAFKVDAAMTSAFASAENLPLPFVFFERKKDSTTSTVKTIEINPRIDDSLFQIPSTSKAEQSKH